MANLTLRLVKGSPLTYAEVDDNFTALNDATGHFKNAIINGNFDIWQRGTSFTTTNYTSDRWRTSIGDGAGTVSRQEFTLGQTAVPNEPRFFFRHARTTASTVENSPIQTRIESVRTFAGQQVTWSFWAKVSSGTKAFTPRMIQNFGAGGSSAVVKTGSNITLTTSWQKFVVTITLDSISGKTIGSNDDDFLQVDLTESSSFGTFTVDFAQAQLEKGDEATEFERRPLGTELSLCQRYYEKSYNLSVNPGTATIVGRILRRAYVTTSIEHNIPVNFKVRKRTIPTITIYSPITGTAARIDMDGDKASTAVNTGEGTTHLQLDASTSASSANTPISAHFVAEAEL